jgi:hypothetical protein
MRLCTGPSGDSWEVYPISLELLQLAYFAGLAIRVRGRVVLGSTFGLGTISMVCVLPPGLGRQWSVRENTFALPVPVPGRRAPSKNPVFVTAHPFQGCIYWGGGEASPPNYSASPQNMLSDIHKFACKGVNRHKPLSEKISL